MEVSFDDVKSQRTILGLQTLRYCVRYSPQVVWEESNSKVWLMRFNVLPDHKTGSKRWMTHVRLLSYTC